MEGREGGDQHSILYVTGEMEEVFVFSSRSEGAEWDSWVHKIKNLSSRLSENPSKKRHRKWLADAQSFHIRFGSSRVPKDTQEAVNSVEEGLGFPLTEWL